MSPQFSRSPYRSSLLTRDEMETRRLRAAELLQSGVSQSKTARELRVSRTTASRWAHTLAAAGREALRKRPAPGRPPRLTAKQQRALRELYRADRDKWTCYRMVDVILDHFGIRFHRDHAGKFLKRFREEAKGVPQ